MFTDTTTKELDSKYFHYSTEEYALLVTEVFTVCYTLWTNCRMDCL